MAKQNKYATDRNISREDRLTGLDYNSFNRTKNFKIGDIMEFIKENIGFVEGIRYLTIADKNFILQKHPSNTVNLTVLEVNDVILGFDPSGNYIMAQYLGGDSTDFSNIAVYNIFNGI